MKSIDLLTAPPYHPKQRGNQGCEPTVGRQAILRYLAEWRFATTTNINSEVQSSQNRNYTWYELDRMRGAGWVASFPVEPSRGSNSELGWLLTLKGAAQIDVPFANHYRRQPSRARIILRDMELELTRTISFASASASVCGEEEEELAWSKIGPAAYSPSRPMPPHTPQYYKLVEGLDFRVASGIRAALQKGQLTPTGQTVMNFKSGQHRYSIPTKTNDWVVWLELQSQSQSQSQRELEVIEWARELSPLYQTPPMRATLAFVMILCPPSAGPKFWESKLNQYTRMSKYLPVYGVFKDEKEQQSAEQILAKLAQHDKAKWRLNHYGTWFKTILLGDVYEELSRLAANAEEALSVRPPGFE